MSPTWGELSEFTWGDLGQFTWSDLETTPAAVLRTVTAYLSRTGWTTDSRSTTRLPAQFWTLGKREVMVPINPDAPDFARRVSDLIGDLGSALEQPVERIGTQLATAGYDVLEISAQRAQSHDYTLALADGVDLLTNVRTMVVAAGCSTLDRRSYHGKSRPKAALNQARVIRMGQTRRGSYVIPILSPVADAGVAERDAEDLNLLPDIERELFPRRVMRTLAGALKTLHELGVERDSMPPVSTLTEAVVTSGVSAELSGSIVGMLSGREVSDIGFGLRWSFLVSEPRSGQLVLDFPKDAIGPLSEITDKLRDDVRVNERIVYGRVTATERDEDEDEGSVTVRALVGTRARPIRVRLGVDDFHLATLAIDQKRRIVMSGDLLELSGHTLTMNRLRYFQLEDTLD
jgi:hypothetical protein